MDNAVVGGIVGVGENAVIGEIVPADNIVVAEDNEHFACKMENLDTDTVKGVADKRDNFVDYNGPVVA